MEELICPNCHIDLVTASFSDLEDTNNGGIFNVHIQYCPECRYIQDCDAE